MTHSAKGVLYVCGTPIGNLQDVSLRLKETLFSADLVACEDTRRTGILLSHLGIKKPVIALHKFAEMKRTGSVIERLLSGESVALVSDAGMPTISDPGSRLVNTAREHGIPIRVVPGPSAVSSALSLSGFSADSFKFGGFPPRKTSQRQKFFSRWIEPHVTAVFFESPHRLKDSLSDLKAVYPDCTVCLCHEMTKMHESVMYGSLDRILEEISSMKILGEWVMVVRQEKKEEDTP